VLKGIFGPEKGWEPGQNYMTRTFIISTPLQIFFRMIKEDRACSTYTALVVKPKKKKERVGG
jgi:hypothetical protein